MNRLMPRSPGAELAMLLMDGFNTMTDEVIIELERRGHNGVRPVHAFALEAIDRGAESASDLGRHLQVSKQAASKTIAVLEELGYVDRQPDPKDARRIRLQVTPRGCELMSVGGALFDAVRARWAEQIGGEQLDALVSNLARLTKQSEVRRTRGMGKHHNVPLRN